MRVLLVGGAGYIGSHTAASLVQHGHAPILLDDLSNAHPAVVDRIARIVGGAVPIVVGDAVDRDVVDRAMQEHAPDAVIHLAGRKAVGESVALPLDYYRVNLGSLQTVLAATVAHGVERFVFSSSATVYEQPRAMLTESDRTGLALSSPYGRTKAMAEWIVRDVAAAHPELSGTLLRYFNPVGAHPSGLIGEDPSGIPSNLLPSIAQVAIGLRDEVRIFGDDYPTPDGTGVRDYVHVADLAEGHVAAIEHARPGVAAINLGTGTGASVREALAAFERAAGRSVPTRVVARRPGDSAEATADASLARELLGWVPTRSLDEACEDAWRWQRTHPQGYRTV